MSSEKFRDIAEARSVHGISNEQVLIELAELERIRGPFARQVDEIKSSEGTLDKTE